MKNIATELKVGLSVIIAITILLISIIWIKEYKFNVERYPYSVLFPNVGTLEKGDPVKVLGVKKGEVSEIQISGNSVLVDFTLTKDVILKKDSKFTIMNIGLMGERFINIAPGEADEALDLSTPVIGYYDTGIPEVMGMAGEALDELRHLVAVLEGSLGTPAMTESMQKIIRNMEKITDDWQYLTEQNKDKMSGAINDLAEASSKLNNLVSNNQDKFANAMENISQGSEKFISIAGRLDSLSVSAHELLHDLSAGQGTIGKALQDDSLYNKLLTATVNLDSLIADFKRNPRRYVKLSIF